MRHARPASRAAVHARARARHRARRGRPPSARPPGRHRHRGFARGAPLHDALRALDFRLRRAKHLVRQRDLARMNAALADIAEPARHPGLGHITLRVVHVGEGPVVGEDARLCRRHAHCEHRGMHIGRVTAHDAQRLEKIPQAQLQAGHARVRLRHGSGLLQATRRLHVEHQPRGPGHAVGALGRLERSHRGPDLLDRLGLGQVQQVQAIARDSGHVGFEMRGVDCVDPHDQRLARSLSRRRAQEFAHLAARLGLALFDHRILEVEGQRRGGARQGLGKELRTRAGDEKLAAHSVFSSRIEAESARRNQKEELAGAIFRR